MYLGPFAYSTIKVLDSTLFPNFGPIKFWEAVEAFLDCTDNLDYPYEE
jgi:hypothetical protein